VTVVALSACLFESAASARDFLPSFSSRSLKEELARPPDIPSDEALEQAGAVIGEIILDINDIFATDTPEEDVVLFRFANFLHNKTKQSTIAQQLLFQSGELFSRQRIEESERLLRTQRYLTSIRIQPVAYRDGRVDIKVFTRDVWTLKPGISFGRSGGTNTLGARIEESNLFGLSRSATVRFALDAGDAVGQ
jgi:hypothetical protein